MLNSSVSLGRTGVPISLISEFASDKAGKLILDLLKSNNISAEHLYLYDGKSPLSLAFLDENNDAEYEFYEFFPDERLKVKIPHFSPGDIIMFGSLMSVEERTRAKLKEILSSANNTGSLVLYDPNFRRTQLSRLEFLKPFICENIAFSDIVRASDEDMELIFGCNTSKEAYDIIQKNGCKYLIYTSSSNGAYLETPLFSKYFPVPELKTVSTIGAGDNFNAGIVFTLYSKNISALEDLSEPEWDDMIRNAIDFASDVCMSTENYISNTFARELKKI